MLMSIRLNVVGSITLSIALVLICAFAVLPFSRSQTMTGGSVAATFRGEWVPGKARCTSALRVIIDANKVTFVKGNDHEEFRKLEQCFTCMGRDVKDVTLLSTDAMGDSPFMIYLDGSKKKAAVQVEFPNDQKLAARFPFGRLPLKKCK